MDVASRDVVRMDCSGERTEEKEVTDEEGTSEKAPEKERVNLEMKAGIWKKDNA